MKYLIDRILHFLNRFDFPLVNIKYYIWSIILIKTFFAAFIISVLFSNLFTYLLVKHNAYIKELMATNNMPKRPNEMFFINDILYFLVSYHSELLIFFIIIYLIKHLSLYKVSFPCPNCGLNVLYKKIGSFTCGLCKTGGHKNYELITFCKQCHGIIRWFKCPNCSKPIDLKARIDFDRIKELRND